jgi:tRNA 2-thiouridine synthesizing protein A
MEPIRLDCLGLRCPQPVLKLAMAVVEIPKGSLVEILGDCPTFEKDVKAWCQRKNLAVLSVRAEGTAKTIQIQL